MQTLNPKLVIPASVLNGTLIQSASLHQVQCSATELVQEAEQHHMLGPHQINSSSSLLGCCLNHMKCLDLFLCMLISVGATELRSSCLLLKNQYSERRMLAEKVKIGFNWF